MLRGLRLRLTLLYLVVALALIVLVGGGTYKVLSDYFQTTTDLALQHRMTQELHQLGAPVPGELAAADRAWSASRDRSLAQVFAPAGSDDRVGTEGAGEHGSAGRTGKEGGGTDDAYDAELAPIFVLPLSRDAQLLADPNQSAPPLAPDAQAVAAALAQGSDWRTVRLSDGTRVRLLTYPLSSSNGPAVLQLGRTLADQDRVLRQLLIGLLGLGGISAVLMGAGSWWLAGRSLLPAQQAWERQQAFVANASHELRTPLTLMRASTEVAQRGLPEGDGRRSLLDDVLAECDYMGRLVEDLLLLSRLDAGRLTLERQAISLPDLLADVQRQMGRLAGERGVQLATESAGATVWGDPTRLRQALLILLDNALRHTPAGGAIRLGAGFQGRQVQITVADTGAGIAPEHLPHVFERFYRADSSYGDERGSSGLGLAIAKALVEAQQGHIYLESRLGEGTRVTLVLPAM